MKHFAYTGTVPFTTPYAHSIIALLQSIPRYDTRTRALLFPNLRKATLSFIIPPGRSYYSRGGRGEYSPAQIYAHYNNPLNFVGAENCFLAGVRILNLKDLKYRSGSGSVLPLKHLGITNLDAVKLIWANGQLPCEETVTLLQHERNMRKIIIDIKDHYRVFLSAYLYKGPQLYMTHSSFARLRAAKKVEYSTGLIRLLREFLSYDGQFEKLEVITLRIGNDQLDLMDSVQNSILQSLNQESRDEGKAWLEAKIRWAVRGDTEYDTPFQCSLKGL